MEHPQLQYILEYALSGNLELPDVALEYLVSLVADESDSDDAALYLLIATCKKVFTIDYSTSLFLHATNALDHLDEIERRRRRYIKAAPQQMLKMIQETTKMFSYVWIALRRWVFAHEVQKRPFSMANCLALTNVLFPRNGAVINAEQYHAHLKQCNMLRMQAVQHLKNNHDLSEFQPLLTFCELISWRKTHTAMKRYLELTHEQIARIEDIVDPIPKDFEHYGFRRRDLVMHRIAHHRQVEEAYEKRYESSPEL